jgi:hypothetical protein
MKTEKREQPNAKSTVNGDLPRRIEMGYDCPSEPVVNPVIAALEKADVSTVVIEGFLGESMDGSVRIYRALDTSTYVDIPKEAVITMQPGRSGEAGAFRAYVRASSEILTVQRHRVRALDWAGGPGPKTAPVLQVGGYWEIVQSNGYTVYINVTQNGDRISAFAHQSSTPTVYSTKAEGYVDAATFNMIITWDNGTKGQYVGRLSFDHFWGNLKGTTWDLNNPGLPTATWDSQLRNFYVA